VAQPKRLHTNYQPYPLYFVTTCTHERRPILAEAETHRSFQVFARNAPGYGIWVGRYVIMPDHLHLFVAFSPDSLNLSMWMKSLKNTLSKTLRQGGTRAPHWQRGFFDHLLRSEESYQKQWQYVRMNPVRAGLVRDPSDWPYQGQIHEVTRASE
jgi:REP element-mobilizing transposase RayT